MMKIRSIRKARRPMSESISMLRRGLKVSYLFIIADTVHQVKESGEAFRSNRAGGDVRRKDQP